MPKITKKSLLTLLLPLNSIITAQTIDKTDFYQFLNTNDINSDEIKVSSWLTRVVQWSDQVKLECNPTGMCIRVSDEWIREQLQAIPDLGDDPTRWMSLQQDANLNQECLASSETRLINTPKSDKSSDNLSSGVKKSGFRQKRQTIGNGGITLQKYWRWCEDYNTLKCQSEAIQNSTHVTFRNTLRTVYQFPSEWKNRLLVAGNPTLKLPFLAVPFQCHYPRDYTINLDIDHYKNTKTIKTPDFKGEGLFDVTIQLFNDDKFNSPLNKSLGLNDRIYAGAIINDKAAHESNIILNFDQLWMTGNATEDSPNYFALVKDGCIINREVSDFKYHEKPEGQIGGSSASVENGVEKHSHEVLFSMKALQFAASDNGNQIYATSFVHAFVRVCLDTDTECTKFCVNKVPLLRRGRDEKQSVLFNYEKRAVIRMLEPIKPLTGFSLSTRPRQVKRSQPVGFVSEFGTSEQRELIVKSRRTGSGRRQKRGVIFTSNSLDLPQNNIADAPRQESSGEGRLAIFSSKQRVKRETGASETPKMQLENNSYTPPVSDDLLDRGSSESSAFASLGPIYWLGDQEPSGSYRDENGNVVHYAVDMADETISKSRLRLVTILSISVIVTSFMLIGVMCYYWRLWTKQQRALERSQTVEEVKI